jgi:hypothetical protein
MSSVGVKGRAQAEATAGPAAASEGNIAAMEKERLQRRVWRALQNFENWKNQVLVSLPQLSCDCRQREVLLSSDLQVSLVLGGQDFGE